MKQSNSFILNLDNLLQGELSAVETYHSAVRSFPEFASHPLIEGTLAAHAHNVGVLRGLILDAGGIPTLDAPPWEEFTQLQNRHPHYGTSKSPLIAVFKAGEKRGVRQYEEALQSDIISEDLKAVIRDDLLPRAWQHWLNLECLAA